ncbi:hypothetical protein LBMAG42_45650 [Deltaproteobacteria bacterium]|nr:hypothetical protein LBMAG42_45650 [Deltaproteobacteria bacterium]
MVGPALAAAVRGWALGLVRLFYPSRTASGAGRVPSAGPVIVVANHPNGLLDPLILRLALDRPVSFLGKSTFWDNPFFRLCVESFGALPVFRAHEADTRQNERTFERCHELLAARGWLALFPEGKSHDETTLQPMKTGAARIALGAGVPVTILPVGLLFEDKDVFRSGVAVAVGEPFVVNPGNPEDREAVLALTAKIAAVLAEVVLQAEDAAVWRAFLAVAHWTGTASLAEREVRARSLAVRWEALAEDDPDAAEAFAMEVRRYSRALRAVGVEDPFAIEAAEPRDALAGLFPLVLLAPVALLGALLAWLPYRLVRPASIKLAAGHVDVIGTIKLLLGFLVLFLTYAGWAIAAGLALPAYFPDVSAWLAALGMLALGPLTGLAALRFDERLTLRREAFRGIAVRLFRPKLALALVERRRELVERVLASLESPPASR